MVARGQIQVRVLGQHAFYPLSTFPSPCLVSSHGHFSLPVSVIWIKWNTLSGFQQQLSSSLGNLLSLTVQDTLTSVKWQVVPGLLIVVERRTGRKGGNQKESTAC